MKKKILFMLLPALMAISAGTALPTAVFAGEGNSENTKELFNPDSAGIDHTWGQFENPEATWDKASQTLTIEIKEQSEWQWGNQVFFSTGITTLDTSKEYQFSFTGTASTDDCGEITFKAFDNNSLVYLNEGLSFTTTPYNYVSEWATPSEASTNGYLVFDFGWDAAQTVTITNISIKEKSKVVSYTIAGYAELMGSYWDPTDTENDMTDMGNGTFQLVKENVTLNAGNYEYKVAGNHAWDVADCPEDGNQSFTIEEDGIYTITFNFTPATPYLTVSAVKTGAIPTPIEIEADILSVCQDLTSIKAYAFELQDNETNFSFSFAIYYTDAYEFGKTYTFNDMQQTDSNLWIIGTFDHVSYSACDFVAYSDNGVVTSIEVNLTMTTGDCYHITYPAHVHAIKTTHTKVEAKCLEAGHEAYYECDCGKYFSDQALTQEIENLETWLGENGDGYIAPIGHDIKKVNGIPATEGTDGFKDAYKCKNCGKYFEDKAGTKLIGDEAAYNAWKLAEGKIPALEPQKENGLSGGAIAGIVIGSVFGLLIIAFDVLYILWKRKNLNVPILSKVLTPAFRFINKLFFKTKLNDVEAKEAENKPMKE